MLWVAYISFNSRSELLEVLEIVHRCENCSSAICVWRSFSSRFACPRIQRQKRDGMRVAPTSAKIVVFLKTTTDADL